MNTITYENREITPSKIVCIGRNYVEHIKELHNEMPDAMVLFNKPNSAISDTLFYYSEDTRFEGEICFLIQNKKIAGVGLGLDLTKADIQNKMKAKGLPWERAKAFNGSAVLSEFVLLTDDVSSLRFELYKNDVLTQFANYELMIYKPDEMLKEILTFMSLEDGDIIMSGTPKGVGTYEVDDVFTVKLYTNEALLLESKWLVKELLETL
ncbi:MAG: fumarylacetoacetate hydrolase family protein [Campylobacterales bacterium]|nr:fumarylacetoacetate hydrolase family protein [Campylobacterales bacterium]